MACANEGSFGPGSDCRPLDFTLFFEASILSLLPDALFVAFALLQLAYLRRANAIIGLNNALFYVKAAVSLLLVASSAASLGTYIRQLKAPLPSIFLPAHILALLGAILLVFLVSLNHSRSPAPSALVICYGLCKGLFSISIIRTYHSLAYHQTAKSAFMAYIASIAAYLLLMLVELVEKKRLIRADVRSHFVGESTNSFVSRSLFVWLFPLMWRGRKVQLTLDDMGDLPEENSAFPARQPLLAALASASSRSQTSGKKTSTFTLLRATAEAFGAPFFIPVIPRLILLAATFMQPFLVNRMVDLVNHPDNSASSAQRAWALVGGYVCVYAVMTISTAVYWEKVYAITVRYRASLIGAIYVKSLRLTSQESRSLGSSAASTYMSVDAERISQGIELIHEIWASILSIPIAVVILYFHASWAAFVPLGVTALVLGILEIMRGPIARRQGAWLGQTDKRIKLLSSVISQFVPIKLSGYEGILGRKIAAIRSKEMDQATFFYGVVVISAALSDTAGIFCALGTLGAYAGIAQSRGEGSTLDVTRIFTVLTTVNLLQEPLGLLGQAFPQLVAAYTSMQRIQTFLLLDEKQEIPTPIDHLPASNENEQQIRMRSASFAWQKDGVPVLHDMDFDLQYGKLHMLVGPVASGKTTFLVSVLGETTLLQGDLEASKQTIAYSSQDAFIFGGTCRDNIVFGRPFIPDWYSTVIAACALEKDFESMPNRDLSKLSDRGTSLSGGQRQRLALARAVYANAPILLLDDVFSALDGETEKHVFDALFGTNGLLRGKTTVLATHNVHRLPVADWIVLLDKGRIQSQGSFVQIQSSSYLAGATIRSSESDITAAADDHEAELAPRNDKEDQPQSVNSSDEDDEAKRLFGGGAWLPYRFYAENVGYSRTLATICGLVFYSAVRLGVQGYIKEWSESNGTNLGGWLGGYTGFAFASVTIGILSYWQFAYSATSIGGKNTHHAELTAVFKAPPSFFLTTPVGRIINRFSADVFSLDFTFPLGALNVIVLGALILGQLIFIWIATPWLTLTIFLGVLYWIILKFYLATSKQLQQLEAASRSELYQVFTTTLTGLESLRAYRAEDFFQEKNDVALNRSQGPYYWRFGGLRFLRTSLALMTMIIAVGIAAIAVALRRTTSAGFLGVALSNLTTISQYLSQVLVAYGQMENGTVGLRRIHEMATLEPESDTGTFLPTGRTDEKNDSEEDVQWPVNGSIAFENVSMKYRDELPPALNDISFSIQGGQSIGICGRSGSGKSSTLMTLFRSIDPSLVSGRILLDGVDIATVGLERLRSSMSLVSQEPFLWYAPLRELLDIEGLCSDDEIWMALKHVGMQEAVSEMPEKLDTLIEDGGSLSRGQKQLLCMARVLLRRSKVVVLDEATSSMDLLTDETIRDVVQTHLSDRTVIAVAHRISTIINFDKILVLDGGRVAEFGSPRDLLRNPKSRFSLLAATQGLGLADITHT